MMVHELTRRSLEFSESVQPGALVRILANGENVMVLRRRARGGGYVVKRAMGTNIRTPFGSSQGIFLGEFIN